MSEVDADATVRRAAALSEAGRHAAAIRLLRPVVDAVPNHASALCQLSVACLHSGNPEEAEQFARRASVVDPTHHWPHLLGSLALSDLGRHAEAAEAARKAVRRDPSQWRCHVALAEALIWGGDRGLYEQAVASAGRAVELAPEEPRTHEVLGDALLRDGDRPRAAAAYRRALAFPLAEDQQADIEANLRIAEERRGQAGRGAKPVGRRPAPVSAKTDESGGAAAPPATGVAAWKRMVAMLRAGPRDRPTADASRADGSLAGGPLPGANGADADTAASGRTTAVARDDAARNSNGRTTSGRSGRAAAPSSAGRGRTARTAGVPTLLRRVWLVQGLGTLALMIQASPDSSRFDGGLGLLLAGAIGVVAWPIVLDGRAAASTSRVKVRDARVLIVGAPLAAGLLLLLWWAVSVLISPGTLSPLSLAMGCTALGAILSLITGAGRRR
ncbi:Flp pilus assembly protein TadD [Actinoalloteichus hoggarensis]|uniref:Cellulose synthase subunit BcsC n=1 Tax=Actinoalloteichus hoggarensis TaxID=1470176 RepID=A0A221VZK0_9PSEU|nr:tetratricopeptide repeat protein [Actinoalloteichus hoggarensis]ASO18949.1 cellulose synthase subunit BcsC [Actinoalloteichus hoggarensis]MBB5920185.1 Flp pilus assembly protein TadD [Actinoalloteichus hoggarensis]